MTRRLRRAGREAEKGAPLYGSSFCLSQIAAYQRQLGELPLSATAAPPEGSAIDRSPSGR
jgi:hypothetical protein